MDFAAEALGARFELLRRRASGAALPEAALDIVDHHLLELGGDRGAAQRHAFLPSMNTGAAGCSPVPGSEMPMSACLLSPGPLTMQPMTATLSASTPG